MFLRVRVAVVALVCSPRFLSLMGIETLRDIGGGCIADMHLSQEKVQAVQLARDSLRIRGIPG